MEPSGWEGRLLSLVAPACNRFPIRTWISKRNCSLVSVFVRQRPSVTLNLPIGRADIGPEPISREGRLLSLIAPACNRFPIRTWNSKRYCSLVSVFARQCPSVSLLDPGDNRRLEEARSQSRARDPPSNPFSTPMAVSNPFSTPVNVSTRLAGSVSPNPPAGQAHP